MTSLLLSGWAHSAEGLSALLPPDCEAHELNYHAFPDFKNLTALFTPISADIVIGWSLGGQVAVRLIAEKKLKCQLLVLIATPYAFVANDATDSDTFIAFEKGFKQNSEATLARFRTIMVGQDSERKKIIPQFQDTPHIAHRETWLSELGNFSCETVDISDFPPTLLIHGKKDSTVTPSQTEHFRAKLPNSSMLWLEHAGHAPHLHDASLCREAITACITEMRQVA
jgi:pimeloyl-ACP methyl ester carboxylesterase